MPSDATMALDRHLLIQASYFVTAALFILGLKRMSSPVTARSGILWAGSGMLVATVVSFLYPDMTNYPLILAAIVVGGGLAWWSGKRVAMTDMPQMIALYNGMGGGAAAAIAAVELYRGGSESYATSTLAVVGGIIGSVSFSGSAIAFGKLQGLITRSIRFSGQQVFNLLLLAAALVLGAMVAFGLNATPPVITAFFALALLLGLTMTLPIGGADMPVVISLYNALTGLAVAFEGFVLNNAAMIIAGTVVGSAGTLLTQLMAKAMNRSIANVLFGAFGQVQVGVGQARADDGRTVRATTAEDVAVQLSFARKVVVVPGYGMAVAQAQHDVRQLADLLEERGVDVKYAIHPVAGRMPGHMNVLLAEANVPYTQLSEMDEINPDFPQTDVALVIGANDVTNPAARSDPASPIYGMPILDVDKAASIIVMKRSMNPGFAGIDNDLYLDPKTTMLFGDAKESVVKLISAVKSS